MELRLCEICRLERAAETCRLCGRNVCSRHYAGDGICVACRESLCSICSSKLSLGYCKYCGRLVCEDCSVEEGAALVCRECAARRGLL